MKTFTLVFYILGVLVALFLMLKNIRFEAEEKLLTKIFWYILVCLFSLGSWIIVALFLLEHNKKRIN